MSAALAQIGPGLADPVHGAQQAFRAVLEAMSRPGRVQALPHPALAGLDAPGLGRGLSALLLSLLDAETRLWLAPQPAGDAAAYLRFHTGVRVVAEAARADFVVVDATRADAALWATLERGSDAQPQAGATLIVEVPSFDDGPTLALRGPGIARSQALRVGGLDAGFWHARRALEADFPRGIDLVLTCGERIAALPRTTRVVLED